MNRNYQEYLDRIDALERDLTETMTNTPGKVQDVYDRIKDVYREFLKIEVTDDEIDSYNRATIDISNKLVAIDDNLISNYLDWPKWWILNWMLNIGESYYDLKQYDKAKEYCYQVFEMVKAFAEGKNGGIHTDEEQARIINILLDTSEMLASRKLNDEDGSNKAIESCVTMCEHLSDEDIHSVQAICRTYEEYIYCFSYDKESYGKKSEAYHKLIKAAKKFITLEDNDLDLRRSLVGTYEGFARSCSLCFGNLNSFNEEKLLAYKDVRDELKDAVILAEGIEEETHEEDDRNDLLGLYEELLKSIVSIEKITGSTNGHPSALNFSYGDYEAKPYLEKFIKLATQWYQETKGIRYNDFLAAAYGIQGDYFGWVADEVYGWGPGSDAWKSYIKDALNSYTKALDCMCISIKEENSNIHDFDISILKDKIVALCLNNGDECESLDEYLINRYEEDIKNSLLSLEKENSYTTIKNLEKAYKGLIVLLEARDPEGNRAQITDYYKQVIELHFQYHKQENSSYYGLEHAYADYEEYLQESCEDAEALKYDALIKELLKENGQYNDRFIGDEVDLIIPDWVTEVRDGTGSHNPKIKSVVFSGNIRRISNYVFEGCPNLEKVVFSHRTAPDEMYNGSGILQNCPKLKAVYFEDFTTFDNYTYDRGGPLENGANLYIDGKQVTTLYIPDGYKNAIVHKDFGVNFLRNLKGMSGLNGICFEDGADLIGFNYGGKSGITKKGFEVKIQQDCPQIEDLRFMEFKSAEDLITHSNHYCSDYIFTSYEDFKSFVLNNNK